MANCYRTPDYYSPSPSSSSVSPYSGQIQQAEQQQQPQVAQYVEAPPVSYEQVNNYQEYCQQYNIPVAYYPVAYPVPNIPEPAPTAQEQQLEAKVDECLNELYQHRQPRRGSYSHFQIKELTLRFLKSDKILVAEREELGRKINLSPEQIKVWFQNRRYKLKKMGFSKTAEKKSPVKANGYKPY